MNKNIIVKKSKIHGRGVFAARNFKKGEVVFRWHSVILIKAKADVLPSKDKHFLYKEGNKYLFMQPPERYVNHSCEPNTRIRNHSDIAIRNIKKDEEITSYYSADNTASFKCKCGSKLCKRLVS